MRQNKENIIFEVQDSGTGFSQEALAKGINMFYTEDTARTGAHHGIGLNFANQVALAHGGGVVISNNATGGLVEFTMLL